MFDLRLRVVCSNSTYNVRRVNMSVDVGYIREHRVYVLGG